MEKSKKTKGASTRERIIATARKLFATLGYEGTSTEAVLAESGVSRGALYHHFENKEALFTAVLEAVEVDLAAASARGAAGAADPVAALRAGFSTFLDRASEPEVRQIILIDSRVVGWQKWRAIEERYGLGDVKRGLGLLAQSGRLPAEKVDILAHVLLAAAMEVAFWIARAENPAEAAEKGKREFAEVLERLVGGG
jgi:AcrR family transcriptional regulator